MHTTEKNVDHLFGIDVQYQVPLYQRRYVWNETDWDAFWNDIRSQADLKLRNENSRHFMGVLMIRPIGSDRLSRFEVIDGQQRLATFQIVLCAIRDICQSVDYTEIAEKANLLILNSQMAIADDTPDAIYKLLPTLVDKDIFCFIIDGTRIGHSRPLLHAYNYFKAQITTYVSGDNEKMIVLLSSVIYDFFFLEISIDLSDTAEKIYTSINSSGQRLSEFDLLRNNLFLRVGGDSDRLHYLYLEYWVHFDEDAFWNPEILDQFLRDFLATKLGMEIETDDLFKVYEQHYRSILKPDRFCSSIHPGKNRWNHDKFICASAPDFFLAKC